MTNTYTSQWFTVFLQHISAEQTAHEVRFLSQFLPPARYATLIDLCCGAGRHAHALATLGYRVIGIDRDQAALAAARQIAAPSVTFLECDMRHLGQLDLSADAVLCLWQSFGYFDDVTNRAVIQQMSRLLRPGGRFILDIYHREFFIQHQGERRFEHHGTQISETKQIVGKRLLVTLDYANSPLIDRFDWRLYTPDEISALASECGFEPIAQCSNYDEQQPATASAPRMQLVFEKHS